MKFLQVMLSWTSHIWAVQERENEGVELLDKVPVFGILKRDGEVYTKIVQDTKTDMLLPVIRIIRRKIVHDSVVYTDFYRS